MFRVFWLIPLIALNLNLWLGLPSLMEFWQSETPIPSMVCSNVNWLNIRSGPGKQFEVVGALRYKKCSIYIGTNSDGTWFQIQEGWVSSEFVYGIYPTLTSAQVIEKPTATPLSEEPFLDIVFDKNASWTGDSNVFKNVFINDPAKAILIFLGLYAGLFSAQNRNFIKGIYKIILVFVFVGIFSMLLNTILGEDIGMLKYLSPTNMLFSFLSFCGTFLGKIFYGEEQRAEVGADIECGVCGQLQKRERMSECKKCHELYCDFPEWKDHSIRSALDKIALWIAVPIFLVLTAISILGGIIALLYLSIPYLLFRNLFPEGKIPYYWKKCGGNSICYKCSPKIELNYSSYSDNSSDPYDDISGTEYLRAKELYEKNNDEDDDEHGGSFGDGWLNKW